MPGYIAEFGGKYCVWSTVVDAPITRLMSEPELFEHFRAENPNLEREAFDIRMKRVHLHGCSAIYGPSKTELLAYNRAGPNESPVTSEDEMVRLYTRSQRHD
jgi:hypothetical protein